MPTASLNPTKGAFTTTSLRSKRKRCGKRNEAHFAFSMDSRLIPPQTILTTISSLSRCSTKRVGFFNRKGSGTLSRQWERARRRSQHRLCSGEENICLISYCVGCICYIIQFNPLLIRLNRLTNYHSSFTCSTINPGGSCLAAGADNSSIQIFNLLPSPKSGSWEESSSSSNSYYHCSAAAADAVSSSSSSSKAKKSFRSHQKTFLASDKIFARARQRYLAESYRESDCRSEVMDDNESSWLDTKCLVGHRGSVYGVAYMPNNTDYLLSCGEDTTLRIWDVETESNKAVYEGHSYPVWCLDVDRLGIYVATGKKPYSIESNFESTLLSYT